jgi:Ribbon-helix-helix protein, copG family
MRTTVTLEADLDARLRQLARERGVPFKQVLNNALRAGLDQATPARAPYRVPTRALRLRPGIDIEHVLRLSAELEDSETVRKLELRK